MQTLANAIVLYHGDNGVQEYWSQEKGYQLIRNHQEKFWWALKENEN